MILASAFALLSAAYTAGSALKTISVFKECGAHIDGVCESGLRCSSGDKSYCLPLSSYTNRTEPVVKVQGYGRPMGNLTDPKDYNTAIDPIPVWNACTDWYFSGSCLTFKLGCDFCIALEPPYANSISSIQILDGRVGCNFWVNSNCIGDGINIDSGAIFDLSATSYNDRIVAFNCYARCSGCF